MMSIGAGLSYSYVHGTAARSAAEHSLPARVAFNSDLISSVLANTYCSAVRLTQPDRDVRNQEILLHYLDRPARA